MPHRQYITSPSDLLRFQNQLSAETSDEIDLQLQLLLPLREDEELLQACREKAIRVPYYPPAQRFFVGDTTEYQELLNLDPLFRQWRSAWSIYPIDNTSSGEVNKFIFDINIPAPRPEEGKTAIVWAHSQSPGCCVVVEEQMSRFIQGLATVMHVRSQGRARFELVGAKEYRENVIPHSEKWHGYFRGIEEVLRRLSEKV